MLAIGAWQTANARLECVRGAEPALACDVAVSRAFGLSTERRRVTGIIRVSRDRVPSGRHSTKPALVLWNPADAVETVVGDDPAAVQSSALELERLLGDPGSRATVTLHERATVFLASGGLVLVLAAAVFLERDLALRRARSDAG
jgi:hypothetical protein